MVRNLAAASSIASGILVTPRISDLERRSIRGVRPMIKV
jgi:hypothetical protein